MDPAIKIKKDKTFGTIYKSEHIDAPLNGINGKLFHKFNFDFDLNQMNEEICLGLSKTKDFKVPTVPGQIPPALKTHDNEIFEFDATWNYSGDVDKFHGMDYQQIRKYLFYTKQITLPWYFILELKPNQFLEKTQDNNNWNETSNLFPYTKKSIESMPFQQIGRVVIYGSWPNSHVPCHRDHLPTSNYDHHINFNPGGYRPVYVYDSINNTKHYLPNDYHFYAYNTTDYHGVDPVTTFSYTVRVDGVYDLTKVNI